MSIALLTEKIRGYLPPEKLSLVEKAYEFALRAHQGQLRESGEPFLQHPLETALILAELGLPTTSLAAALLHDVVEDCNVPLSELEANFGPEVAKLVDGVTKLSKISWQLKEKTGKTSEDTSSHAESLRKMLVAMAEDLQVVFIKLADRLHNMRTLKALPPQKQRHIAQETREIYAPLAHRLGIWEIKGELEDLAFSHLQPQEYQRIAHLVERRVQMGENLIARVIQLLKEEFPKVGLEAEVSGRPKNLYSIYHKMEKYASRGKEFGDIYDILAIRVLVNTKEECYQALGVIHSLWHPLAAEFNDYIANPKDNSYQSLHTTAMCFGTAPLEIQIRTYEMHRLAEYGVAAHWRYKEGSKRDPHFEEKIAWLRQLIEWHKELTGTAEFLESVKTDIFKDQVFVYTPKGAIKDLPAGSTPIDFAYSIHTDLGHRCIGAKTNGRLVPLNYQLQNGDTVEILSAKASKGPSRDWLNPNLRYTNTSHAREKIRQWFKKQERPESIERGRGILEKELRRLGISLASQEEIARLFKLETTEDLYAAIGYGEVSTTQIVLKLTAQQEQPRVVEPAPAAPLTTSAIQVLGVGDLLTRLARCCHPLPGDDIIGYITRSRGITVHCQDCPNIIHEDEKERLISVDWGRVDQVYPTRVRIEAWDRVGLLRDLSGLIAEEKLNITSVSSVEHEDNTVTISLTVDARGIAQLSRLLSKIEGVRNVISATRVMDGKRG